ncbi:MAG: gliding motility protein GldN [Microscillaceae bacterium]|nr:gliding motility protein GldN [Microscillaceae bacterium]MDW8460557.1 gliding motility protein GldN [Cytophagales bacterium]
MKRSVKKIVGLLPLIALYLFVGQEVLAQFGPMGYNPNSVRPILESDIMYRTTVTRQINLLEKQNKPFFSAENEITRVIIEAVKAKKIQPYRYTISPTNNGLTDPMPHAEFVSKLKYYDSQVGDSVELKPTQLFLLEMKEDLIFDRRRSRMYWDIQVITIVVPQGTNDDTQMGAVRLASFSFKELHAYFTETYRESEKKGTIEDVRAFWYNPENPRRHMSLADAFDLRLFSSRITKVSNPDDKSIQEIVTDEYGTHPDVPKKVLYMSQKIEYDLMEYEHNLWEY